MKKWISMLALSAGILLPAAEKVLLDESFEKLIPGETPKEWSRLWGKEDCTFFGATNERSVSGRNSIVFDLGDKSGGGYVRLLPEASKGIIVFEFKFLYDQAGAHMGFEMRDKVGNTIRLLSFGFAGSTFKFRTFKEKAAKVGGQIPGLQKDTWYHVKLEMPASPADGNTVKLALTDLRTKKTTELELDYVFPKKFAMFVPCLGSAKSPFKVFIDDLKVSVRE